MAAEAGAVQVAFPEATSALLEALNQQRLEGQLCDLAIHVQGRVFRAHRAVLAACSPYFHDQVLLKDMSSVVLPSVMDPAAFELVLGSAYTGRLRMGRDEIVNFLTVGSVLQMWHIVDTCTQLLKERQRRPDRAAAAQASSSSGSGASRGSGGRGGGGGGESQSPSSSSYFSPLRDGPEQPRGGGGGARGGGERDEDGLCRAAPRRRPPDPAARAGRSAPEPDDGAPGEPGSSEARRPSSLRPGLVPPRQWLPVKKERGGLEEEEEEEEDEEEEEEDLVLTCEEDEEAAEPAAALSISDVRTLSGPPPPPPEEQVNFCESSQDVAAAFEEPFPPPRPLLPLDVRGPPLLLFPGASGAPSAVGAAPPSSVEHGAVQLSGGSGEGSKIFLCHCGKAFSHKSMRDRHVNMHLNLRPFDCPVCNKKFKMKHHLTEHMKTHTGLKPYECHVCAKKFMWRDSFMRHKGHCERRHRLGGGGGGGGPAALCGGAKKEEEEGASPSCIPGEADWATGRSPRSELGFAGSSKM
ncbi:zinc finger and BTB domain-containing protein 22 [Crotalus tigris]|uniref:zinc finger and BTB domain-containing protein 22 n=1 Tax=Crotalus tigris TaxID=88082 RepID=UPI00192F9185|nr:zinc finger and BTB domain-containing protein 22 [Crotalus tigris]